MPLWPGGVVGGELNPENFALEPAGGGAGCLPWMPVAGNLEPGAGTPDEEPMPGVLASGVDGTGVVAVLLRVTSGGINS